MAITKIGKVWDRVIEMIVDTLKENFDYLCVVDTEFKGQQDEGQLNDPVCVVVKN